MFPLYKVHFIVYNLHFCFFSLQHKPLESDNGSMKKLFLLCVTFFLFCGTSVFAEKEIPESKFSYEYREIAQSLMQPKEPFLQDGHIVFSAKNGPRYVGIAFDFENYQVIHNFAKKSTTDIDGKIDNTWYFYILKLPEDVETISYRLIIDGLWTADPMNPNREYDINTGIQLSKFEIGSRYKNQTENKKSGESVHFVYKGESGKKVRLAGTFTNWDSWIYELKETSYGVYEIDLPLPKGTYYYTYFIGTMSIPDRTNPHRAYGEDGKTVSVVTVN